ncbi:MAG: SpoIIE family protein phosphatase [Clostridia bacterium]|nr:SpoIIE family protein phosphatase [Clostridia bacterium]
MKEVVKNIGLPMTSKKTKVLEIILKQVFFAFVGFISTRVQFFGYMRPFGISFCAASPPCAVVFCFLGTAIGYVFPSDASSFVYLASAAAASAIRLVVTKYLGKKALRAWSFCSASLLLFLTGAVSSGDSFLGLATVLTEAITAGLVAYFTELSFEQNAKSQYAVILTGAVLLSGLISIEFASISVGIILIAIIISLAGEYGGAAYGALFGVVCGISLLIAKGNSANALIIIICAWVAGLCAPFGKIAIGISISLAAALVSIAIGITISTITLLSSLLIGVVIYILLPRSILLKAAVFFRKPVDTDTAFGIRKSLEMRLKFTSDALRRINNIMVEVSQKLLESDKPTFDRVLAGTKREACAGCSFSECCWKLERAETERTMKEMARSVHNRRPLSLTELSSSFEVRCPRKEKVENAIMKFYSRYQNETLNDQTARHVRNALYDQFTALSEMLDKAADDIKNGENYNIGLSKSIAATLCGLGLSVKRCLCSTNPLDKMKVEIILEDAPELPVSRSKIRESVGNICGRSFGTPEIVHAETEYLLTLCEQVDYDIEYSSFSIKSTKSAVCGDNAEQFSDGKGNSYLVISDGMGTGKRAAIDSRMATSLASRLITAGFDFSPMLKLLNTSMMYRSGEESLATLDIAEVNLYSGDVTLYKAGSAPTLIRRQGVVKKAECHSLPLGILRNVNFEKIHSKLQQDDIILMMSDGATNDGTDWIKNELENYCGSAQKLCEQIATKAQQKRNDKHTDDITVSAAIIHKAI